MTLIVLLILAAVSLSAVFSEKGIFSRAEESGTKYNEAKAKEVLETVLLADGQYEKNMNPKYDQDEFLDELIIKEIPGSRIQGDVAIIGGWAFELDRSVPKIGRPLGKADKLVLPTVEIISGPTLIENGKKATFEAKVTETTKGVSRIELWLDGKKIDKETKTYETLQKDVTVKFEVNKNGKYTVKAYADLMGKATTTVEGIVPTVSFTPNGSTEWKKQHTTKVTVEETAETITGIQYLWVKDDGVNEPDVTLFTQNCPIDRIITGGNDTMTGTYYLWILLTIGTGETQRTSIYSSQGFNFDNEGPKVTLEPTPLSETSFKLSATAMDNHSEIAKYEFYIDGEKHEPDNITDGVATYIWNGTGMVENKNCYVIVTDLLGNVSEKVTTLARTKLYNWEISQLIKPAKYGYKEESASSTDHIWISGGDAEFYIADNLSFNENTGTFYSDTRIKRNWENMDLFINKWVAPANYGPSTSDTLSNVLTAKWQAIYITKWEKRNGMVDYIWGSRRLKIYIIESEIWGNEKTELTIQNNKYVDGEIKNNFKYTYKGLA